MWKKIIRYWSRCSKTCFQKSNPYKVAEAAGEFIENKITDKIVKPKHIIDENQKIIEEITIPPEKKKYQLNKLR